MPLSHDPEKVSGVKAEDDGGVGRWPTGSGVQGSIWPLQGIADEVGAVTMDGVRTQAGPLGTRSCGSGRLSEAASQGGRGEAHA